MQLCLAFGYFSEQERPLGCNHAIFHHADRFLAHVLKHVNQTRHLRQKLMWKNTSKTLLRFKVGKHQILLKHEYNQCMSRKKKAFLQLSLWVEPFSKLNEASRFVPPFSSRQTALFARFRNFSQTKPFNIIELSLTLKNKNFPLAHSHKAVAFVNSWYSISFLENGENYVWH